MSLTPHDNFSCDSMNTRMRNLERKLTIALDALKGLKKHYEFVAGERLVAISGVCRIIAVALRKIEGRDE